MNNIYWSNKTPFKTAKSIGKRITFDEFDKLSFEKLKKQKKHAVLLNSNGDFIAAPILYNKRNWKYWYNITHVDGRLMRVFIIKSKDLTTDIYL